MPDSIKYLFLSIFFAGKFADFKKMRTFAAL